MNAELLVTTIIQGFIPIIMLLGAGCIVIILLLILEDSQYNYSRIKGKLRRLFKK